MKQKARHFVFSGLSASGKTTMAKMLAKHPGVEMVPEHNDWIGGSHNFPKAPNTVDEKRAKQEFFMRIDLERHKWVEDHSEQAKMIISDADFTSPLAHNYAERWLYPKLNVYEWLVDSYCKRLKSGELAPANFYVYLDPDLDERRRRRGSDTGRRRNDMFFTEPFPTRMRRFYWTLLHPVSPRAALQGFWHPYLGSAECEEGRLWEWLQKRTATAPPRIDIDRLIEVLHDTISDPPDLETD
jgi:deoxyadenosine/deoxycytidine kinase